MADVARDSDQSSVVLQGEGQNEAKNGEEDAGRRKRRRGEKRGKGRKDDVLHPVRMRFIIRTIHAIKRNRLVNRALFRGHNNIGKWRPGAPFQLCHEHQTGGSAAIYTWDILKDHGGPARVLLITGLLMLGSGSCLGWSRPGMMMMETTELSILILPTNGLSAWLGSWCKPDTNQIYKHDTNTIQTKLIQACCKQDTNKIYILDTNKIQARGIHDTKPKQKNKHAKYKQKQTRYKQDKD